MPPVCVPVQFHGIALVKKLHTVSQLINGIVHIMYLCGAFISGVHYAILGVILLPVSLVIQAAAIKVGAELAASVLLVPFLLANNGREAKERVLSEVGAYGVTAGGVALPMDGSSV